MSNESNIRMTTHQSQQQLKTARELERALQYFVDTPNASRNKQLDST